MDYNPEQGIEEKRSCWKTWLDDHVYNQPDDKLEYAQLRLDDIDKGVSTPGPPGPEGAFNDRPTPNKDLSEAPAAPMSEAEMDAGVFVDAGNGKLPWYECEMLCKATFRACRDTCISKSKTCSQPCAEGYKTCMGLCFK